MEKLKEYKVNHMVHNPTLELRCLVAHFECARGSSSERQKLPKQPLECSGGAAGHAGLGAAGAHRGGRGAEKVQLFLDKLCSKFLLLLPRTYYGCLPLNGLVY